MRFPSDLPPVQRKMVAYGYRTIVSMLSCWKCAKPFPAIGPHFLTQGGPNQLFFKQNEENNNLLSQIVKSLKIAMFVLDFYTKIRLEISLLK